MAQGKQATNTVIVNNMPTNTVSKTIELIVINGNLVHDPKDLNPGVNSRTM